MTHTVADLIQAAVALLRARRRLEARQLLEQALAREPLNDTIWLWLSGTTDDPVEQGQLLRRALAYNPHNQLARRGLAALEARLAAETPVEPPPAPAATASWSPPEQATAATPAIDAAPEPPATPSAAPAGWPAAAPHASAAEWPADPAPPLIPAPVPAWPDTQPGASADDPTFPPEPASAWPHAQTADQPGADWRTLEPMPRPADDSAFPPAPAPEPAPAWPHAQTADQPGADWQTLETVGDWQALAAEPAAPEPPAEPQPWAPPEPLSAPALAELAATCAGCEAQVYGNAAFCWRCHAAIHCCATCTFAAEPTCKELQQISGMTARNRCPWWRPPS